MVLPVETLVRMGLNTNTIFSIALLTLNAILLLFAAALILRVVLSMRKDKSANSSHRRMIQ
jgi:hypothetical protein